MPTFRHKRTGRLVESDDLARYDNARWRQVSDEAPQPKGKNPAVILAGGGSAKLQSDAISGKLVPDGTVADVLEWVGDDPDRANAALEAEEAGKRRKGILDALT